METVLLLLNEELAATLHIYATDQPWFIARFEPTQLFDKVKHLFERELEALENEDFSLMDKIYDEIYQIGLRLKDADGQYNLGEFLLHIRGKEASLRCEMESITG